MLEMSNCNVQSYEVQEIVPFFHFVVEVLQSMYVVTCLIKKCYDIFHVLHSAGPEKIVFFASREETDSAATMCIIHRENFNKKHP